MATATPRDDLASLLEALADPTRREVVELLTSGPRRAGDLAATSGVAPSAMSRHLRVLLEAGLVADERGTVDARVRMFSLRPDSTRPLRVWLDELQAQWDLRLGAFRDHVESKDRQ